MIAIASLWFAALAWFCGKDAWDDGGSLIFAAAVLYGASFVCMSWLKGPVGPAGFSGAYVLYCGAISCSIAAVYRFSDKPAPTLVLLALPLATAGLFELFLEMPQLRTRSISILLLSAYIWQVCLVARCRPALPRLGGWSMLTGAMLLGSTLLLRIVHTTASIAVSAKIDGAKMLLLSFAALFVAVHLQCIGFWLMARHRAAARHKQAAPAPSDQLVVGNSPHSFF